MDSDEVVEQEVQQPIKNKDVPEADTELSAEEKESEERRRAFNKKYKERVRAIYPRR